MILRFAMIFCAGARISLYWYVFKFGICHGYPCVADAVFRVWDVLCCKRCACRRLGSCAVPVLQTTKGYVLTGNLKYWVSFKFSAKYKKWYVLVSINMYCVCIGMYLYVLYGAQGVCIGRYCKYWVCICMYWFWVSLFSMRVRVQRRSTVG